MKKLITAIAITCIASSAVTTHLQAQDYAFSLLPIKKAVIIPAEFYADTTVTLESTQANLANSSSKSMKEVKKAAREFKQFSRLTRNFAKDYQGVTDVHWDSHKTCFSGLFTKDGLRNIVWYSRSGRLLTSMVSYDEARMDSEIKSLINDAFPGYNIEVAQEIRQDNILVHVVTISNDKYIKLVRICEGEMDIYKEYQKG